MTAFRLPRPLLLLLCAVPMCALFTSCAQVGVSGGAPEAPEAANAEQASSQGDFDRAAQMFLDLADAQSGERAHFRLRAAEAFYENGETDAAAQALDGIKQRRLGDEENVRYRLLEAEVALAQQAPARALEQLKFADAELPMPMPLRLRMLELRARAEAANGDAAASARTRAALNRWLGGADRAQNEAQLVATLQKLDPDALKQQAAALPPGDALQPWLNQALHKNGQALPLVVLRPNQPAGTLMPDQNNDMQREGYRPVHLIGLLLPVDGALRGVAQAVRDGFFAAHFADKNPQRAEVRVYDSGGTAHDAVAAYAKAVADGADHVVGPLTRDAVSGVFAQGHLSVPVLALNQPEHGEAPAPGSAAFGLAPDTEAAQAAEHMIERGITRAVVVTATDDWAERAALAFRAQYESRNGQVLNEARLSDGEVNFSTMIHQVLAGVTTTKDAPALPGAIAQSGAAAESDTGIFISMRPQQARLLLPQIKLAGYAGMPVFATSHIYAGDYNPGLDRDLNGVEFCDAPWLFDAAPGVPKRSEIGRSLDTAHGAGARLFAMGLDAYALLPYLEWLSQHRDSYIAGATGQLAEDNLGRIQRLLIWAQFDNGAARPINGGLSISAAPQ
jgi:uncharacterized protein